jgi:hypothetical protein
MAFFSAVRSGETLFGYSKQESRDKAAGKNADVPKGCMQEAQQRCCAPWLRRITTTCVACLAAGLAGRNASHDIYLNSF